VGLVVSPGTSDGDIVGFLVIYSSAPMPQKSEIVHLLLLCFVAWRPTGNCTMSKSMSGQKYRWPKSKPKRPRLKTKKTKTEKTYPLWKRKGRCQGGVPPPKHYLAVPSTDSWSRLPKEPSQTKNFMAIHQHIQRTQRKTDSRWTRLHTSKKALTIQIRYNSKEISGKNQFKKTKRKTTNLKDRCTATTK
jgi:hypothetical protein